MHASLTKNVQSILSILDTLGPKNCPYYRGVLISQVHFHTFIMQWTTTDSPDNRGIRISECPQ